MKIKVFLLNSFGVTEQGGNPAGVVLNVENLTDQQKQQISKEVGFSETAFVEKSTKADYKVTFFSPSAEIALCGHATIAAWALLLNNDIIAPGEYTQEIKAGNLKIFVSHDGKVVMDQLLPEFKKTIAPQEVAESLNIPSEWITKTNLVPQVVSTGLNDLHIPIDTRAHLFAIKLQHKQFSDFQEKHNLDSLHVFTFDTVNKESITNSRNFDPLHAIPEESATGSAHGGLACYLYKNGKLTNHDLRQIKFEQGYSMDKPSEIVASLTVKENHITRVQVGGRACILGEKSIDDLPRIQLKSMLQ